MPAQPFLGEIYMEGFNFAPLGFAMCQGQLLPISQNNALFALLGTTYGGNGTTTFALPDLRGRVPINLGQGPGLSSYAIGESSGEEQVTLTSAQMPAHSHAVQCTGALGDQRSPVNAIPAQEATGQTAIYSDAAVGGQMRGDTIAPAGGNQPHSNLQPFLVLNFVIALQGVFPTRA